MPACGSVISRRSRRPGPRPWRSRRRTTRARPARRPRSSWSVGTPMRTPRRSVRRPAPSIGSGSATDVESQRIVPGDHPQQQRRVAHRQRERADLVERRRERDQAVAGDGAVRRLQPTTPHSAAGWRIEPPVSVPSESGASPAATAAAEPPLEPPGTRVDVPGVVGGAERGVLGRRAHRELVHVGLAERDRGRRRCPADTPRRRTAGRGPPRIREPAVVSSPACTGCPCRRSGRPAGPERPSGRARRPPRARHRPASAGRR